MTSLIYWGLAMAFALLFGYLARRFRLPSLIGYVVGGFVVGPSLLNILPEDFVKSAEFFEHLTLAFILFLIGTMVRVERLRNLGFRILKPAFLQVLGAFFLVYLGGILFLPDFRWPIILAIIAMATAPAATAMIIEEYNASGPLTDSVVTSVVIDNFLVITLFFFLLPVALGKGFFSNIERLLFSLLGSIGVGIAFGLVLSYIETKVEDNEILFAVSLSILLLSFGVALTAQLFLFVMALFFGVTAGNSSLRNLKAVKSLKIIDFPVYALFFIIAGASLHVNILVRVKYAVLLYIFLRMLGKWLGATLGVKWGNLGLDLRKYLGFGIVSHAGLATGLAVYLGGLGNPAASYIMNIVLASTVFFELAGPLLLKEVLVRAGEVKVISIIKGGTLPILDIEFQTVLRNLVKTLGLPDPFRSKIIGEPRVQHVMRRHFIFVEPKHHLDEMVKAFEKAHSTALPVLDEKGNYHGLLLLHDLEILIIDALTTRLIVAEDALEDIPGVSKDETLKSVFKRFRELGVDALPVVEENRVIGVVMRKDVLATLI